MKKKKTLGVYLLRASFGVSRRLWQLSLSSVASKRRLMWQTTILKGGRWSDGGRHQQYSVTVKFGNKQPKVQFPSRCLLQACLHSFEKRLIKSFLQAAIKKEEQHYERNAAPAVAWQGLARETKITPSVIFALPGRAGCVTGISWVKAGNEGYFCHFGRSAFCKSAKPLTVILQQIFWRITA